MAILCGFLPKGGLKFHLLEGERLLAECDGIEREEPKDTFFIRITDLRMVLSSKSFISATGVGKPAHIDYEFERADIKSFKEEKGSMMSKDKLIIELEDPSKTDVLRIEENNKFILTGKDIDKISMWLKGGVK